MSGRKACEVASVLSQTEEIQNKIFSSYENEINKENNEVKIIIQKIQSSIDKAPDFDSRILDINKDSQNVDNKLKSIQNEIIQENEKADSIRNKIRHSSHYMTQEYNQAQVIKTNIQNLKDKFVNLKHNTTTLKNSANKLNIDFNEESERLAKKKYSETLLQDTKSKGIYKELILIENIVENKNIEISKFEYYDNYKKANTLNDFNSLIEKAQKYIGTDDFDKCNDTLQEAKIIYEKISNEADSLRENIEASANLAMKIRNIMLGDEIDFRKAHLEIIDDNPINGFRLKCENSDTINFEEIKFNNNKDLVINLDHIENTNGTCGIRWSKMQKVFNDSNIPLTDVKKNGHSVIYTDVRKTKKTTDKSRNRGQYE